MDQDDDYLAVSGIQHFAFCPRQWALIHIENQWHDNVLTVEGQHVHERVDDIQFDETRGDLRIVRSMPIVSHRLRIRGIADMVELRRVAQSSATSAALRGRAGYWTVSPIEYKRGRSKPDDRDVVQLCAQALCLEEMMGVAVTGGAMYYAQTHRRESVDLGDDVRERVEALVRSMRSYYEQAATPAAVLKSHCKQCSLLDICQPKLSSKGARSAADYVSRSIGGGDESDAF